jgi:hypothetical protein
MSSSVHSQHTAGYTAPSAASETTSMSNYFINIIRRIHMSNYSTLCHTKSIFQNVCMYKRWALTALAPRPTVVYCASPFFNYPFSNHALRT